MPSTRHIIGCMTGTSLDALDAALVRIEGEGLALRATHVRTVSRPLGPLGPRLRAVAEQLAHTAADVAALGRDLAMLHAEAIRELAAAGPRADLICAHGQTVFHNPPLSWQLLSGPVLAREANVPLVYDLRAADLAAGGQGAPITPIADLVLFGHPTEPRAVVNLGGFCNFTTLPALGDAPDLIAARTAALPHVRGGDVCACNHVLDTVARRVLGTPFDAGGAAALGGTVHEDALDDLLGIFAAQSAAGRSLGTGDEVASWVGRQWKGGAGVTGPDLCTTACEAIADAACRAVARVRPGTARVLVAGGGARNRALVRAFASVATFPVETTTEQGVPVESREAVCFAVLGALCRDRVPITLPQITGVTVAPVAGVWAWP